MMRMANSIRQIWDTASALASGLLEIPAFMNLPAVARIATRYSAKPTPAMFP
ncbi:hypothetical protein [Desulfotruncus alcoholivorax]|uniref:hypothetical protein n=1 Tax=Desulfotruncus alcoholivorax TaxID=265477 RepID=UPI0012FF5414|nr:hypothetical protein [Desulfotruncus alcoholivorax]